MFGTHQAHSLVLFENKTLFLFSSKDSLCVLVNSQPLMQLFFFSLFVLKFVLYESLGKSEYVFISTMAINTFWFQWDCGEKKNCILIIKSFFFFLGTNKNIKNIVVPIISPWSRNINLEQWIWCIMILMRCLTLNVLQ